MWISTNSFIVYFQDHSWVEMSSGRGSLSDDFDSIINVIGLSPNDPLEGFGGTAMNSLV